MTTKQKTIISTVCKVFGVTYEDLQTKSKKQYNVFARAACYTFLYDERKGRIRTAEIGKLFNRDHSTVLWGFKIYEDLMITDKFFKAKVDLISSKLNFEKQTEEAQRKILDDEINRALENDPDILTKLINFLKNGNNKNTHRENLR
jgi:hypothetical protein